MGIDPQGGGSGKSGFHYGEFAESDESAKRMRQLYRKRVISK